MRIATMNALTNSTATPAEAPKFAPLQLVPNALLSTPDLGTVARASRATIYAWISAGLMTAPIKLGAKSSAWPASEVNTILAARIRGASDDEIRALVKDLTAARKHCA
jgi:prophage regulatory protein